MCNARAGLCKDLARRPGLGLTPPVPWGPSPAPGASVRSAAYLRKQLGALRAPGAGLEGKMRDEAIRRRVERYGLKVVCLSCGARGRHRPSFDGRLRERPCPKCGGTLRARWWIERNDAKAAALAAAERKVRAAVTTW